MVPRRQAASTPVMSPSTIEITVPATIMGIVYSSGCLMSSQTGLLSATEVPMSPWASRSM